MGKQTRSGFSGLRQRRTTAKESGSIFLAIRLGRGVGSLQPVVEGRLPKLTRDSLRRSVVTSNGGSAGPLGRRALQVEELLPTDPMSGTPMNADFMIDSPLWWL